MNCSCHFWGPAISTRGMSPIQPKSRRKSTSAAPWLLTAAVVALVTGLALWTYWPKKARDVAGPVKSPRNDPPKVVAPVEKDPGPKPVHKETSPVTPEPATKEPEIEPPRGALRIDTPEKQAEFDLLDSKMQQEIRDMAVAIDGGPRLVKSWRSLREHPEFFDRTITRKWLIEWAKRQGFDELSSNFPIRPEKLEDAMVAYAMSDALLQTQAVYHAQEVKKAGGLNKVDDGYKQFIREHRQLFGLD